MDFKDLAVLVISFIAGYYLAAHYGGTARPV
jgi:hypothetical protein